MNSLNKKENGEKPRLQFTLTLGGERERKMTATVMVTALDNTQQARFDAEVDNLLLQMIQKQSKKESSKCPTPLTST